MPKGEGQGAKILYILKILWECSDESHPLTAMQFIEKLKDYGIAGERKSVYSDLKLLEDFGFDIVRTKKGAYMGSRLFELPELKLLVDAVQASRFITEKKSEELTNKLSNMLSWQERKQFKRQVIVRNRVKSMNESIYYNVDAIHEAIAKEAQVTFTYWNWNEKKKMVPRRVGNRYQVSPWALLWEDEKYYLVGYEEVAECMKHFRVDKMRDIRVVDTTRLGEGIFSKQNIESYRVEHFSMFGGKTETVTLKVGNELAGAVIDRFGQDVWLRPVEKDHFHVVVDVAVSNQFFGWVTGFAGAIEIVAPVWVREQYKSLLEKILNWDTKGGGCNVFDGT
ncbi:MAG: WYL domain-containing protein [Lachnospiraceae bacterium]|nr:WYL domain-containing protein [Lachnospiraceae bacterium]